MQKPSAQATRAVIQRYRRLLQRYRAELGNRPFVLPTSAFFPDVFLGDEVSAVALSARMQKHAGLEDVPILCRVVTSESASESATSCGSGACGVPQSASNGFSRVIDTGDSWLLQVPAAELKHPVALTTNLARSLAFIFLVETKLETEVLEPPVDVTADLAAVALGFGTLMLQGSYIYVKSCGGPQVASVTNIGVSELSIAVALFAELNGHRLGPALKALEATQRSALREAGRLVRGNPKVLAQLRTGGDAGALADFDMAPTGALLTKVVNMWTSRRRTSSLNVAALASMDIDELEAHMISMPPSTRAGRPATSVAPPADELKSLVREALSPREY